MPAQDVVPDERVDEQAGDARRWWVLITMTVCLLVVIMGNTTLNVALPTPAA